MVKHVSPGEYFPGEGKVEINKDRETTKIKVTNTGDRPIQVGSHFHFFEVNKALKFDREKAFGKRLNVPAGTAKRFEPGEERELELVEFAGKKYIYGLNNLTNGSVKSENVKEGALKKAKDNGFKGV